MKIASSRKKLEVLIQKAHPQARRLAAKMNRKSFSVEKAEAFVTDLHKAAARLALDVTKTPTKGPQAETLKKLIDFEIDHLRDMIREGSSSAPRFGMYVNAIRKTFEAMLRDASTAKWERRILNPLCKHCEDCIRYARQGWSPLGSLASPGQNCKCISNCKCRFDFSSSPRRPVNFSAMDWQGDKHPRGDDKNKGHFASKSQSGSTDKASTAKGKIGASAKKIASQAWGASKQLPGKVVNALANTLSDPKSAFDAVCSAIHAGAMGVGSVFHACEHAIAYAVKACVPEKLRGPAVGAFQLFMSSYTVGQMVLEDALTANMPPEKAQSRMKWARTIDILGSKATFVAVEMAGGSLGAAGMATMVPVATSAMLIHAIVTNPKGVAQAVAKNAGKVKAAAKKVAAITSGAIKLPDSDVMQAMSARFSAA